LSLHPPQTPAPESSLMGFAAERYQKAVRPRGKSDSYMRFPDAEVESTEATFAAIANQTKQQGTVHT